jgi:hypothetical protein
VRTLSITEVARLRAAIARDQTRYWARVFWQTAPTKKELDRRERNWFWWGGTGWIAEQAAHGRWLTRDQSFARGR